MPLFETESGDSPHRVFHVFTRGHLPFLLAAAIVAVSVMLIHPQHFEDPLMGATGILLTFTTLAAVLVPWRKMTREWAMIIPALDLVIAGMMRVEFVDMLPAIGIVALFPLLWLGYAFPRYGIWVIVPGAFFTTGFEYLYTGTLPGSTLEWVRGITLPLVMIAIAGSTILLANQIRRQAQALKAAHVDQAKSLRDAQDNYILVKSILDTVNAAVVFYDAEGVLRLTNTKGRAMASLAGYSLEEAPHAGADVYDADRTSAIAFDAQLIPQALSRTATDHPLHWVGPGREQVALVGSSRRVHRDDGAMLGTVIVAYDVTELAEESELADETTVDSDFASTLARELRTPAARVIGLIDVIDDAVDPREERVHEHLASVRTNAHTLLDRINELLASGYTR